MMIEKPPRWSSGARSATVPGLATVAHPDAQMVAEYERGYTDGQQARQQAVAYETSSRVAEVCDEYPVCVHCSAGLAAGTRRLPAPPRITTVEQLRVKGCIWRGREYDDTLIEARSRGPLPGAR